MLPDKDPNFESVKLPYNMGDRELFPDGRYVIYKHKTELKSCALVTYEQKFHGPPQFVHGGAQAYILDEVMGCTGWMHEIPVVAKKIEVEFLLPTPLETQLLVHGEIISKDATIVNIKAKMCDQDGKVYSQSSGQFRIITSDKVEQFVT